MDVNSTSEFHDLNVEKGDYISMTFPEDAYHYGAEGRVKAIIERDEHVEYEIASPQGGWRSRLIVPKDGRKKMKHKSPRNEYKVETVRKHD